MSSSRPLCTSLLLWMDQRDVVQALAQRLHVRHGGRMCGVRGLQLFEEPLLGDGLLLAVFAVVLGLHGLFS